MRAHTLAPSILPLLETPVEGFFWNPPEFSHHIRFDVLHGCETCPLEAHFQSRVQPKVTCRRTPMTIFVRNIRSCILFSKDLQRPSCDIQFDPWSAASEQTLHWHVSTSNCRRELHEWIRERCQHLVPTPRRWFFDHTESVVALFQSFLQLWMSKASRCTGHHPTSPVHS